MPAHENTLRLCNMQYNCQKELCDHTSPNNIMTSKSPHPRICSIFLGFINVMSDVLQASI